ncbi:DNA cytosine methyltransferase [Nostoc sp.]
MLGFNCGNFSFLFLLPSAVCLLPYPNQDHQKLPRTPRVFTLENVPRYQNSQSFSIILSALEQEGYSVDYSVVNMDKFGLPQALFP